MPATGSGTNPLEQHPLTKWERGYYGVDTASFCSGYNVIPAACVHYDLQEFVGRASDERWRRGGRKRWLDALDKRFSLRIHDMIHVEIRGSNG